MAELVVDDEQFTEAVNRLETLVDGFERPRNLIHSINEQDGTLWADVAGTAGLRRDFSLSVEQMQLDIDNIWAQLTSLGTELSKAGEELHAADAESGSTLAKSAEKLDSLTERLNDEPRTIPGATPTMVGGAFGMTPMMV